MRSMAATRRLIGAFAFLSALGWPGQAHAQLGVGTTWLRTDAQGKGITLSLRPVARADFVSSIEYHRWAVSRRRR